MLLKGTVLDPARFAICVLTEYELGNIIWKDSRDRRIKSAGRVAEIFAENIGPLDRYGVDNLPGVLRVALERNLTYYDASYAHLAEAKGLVLITQDGDLRKKTKNAIDLEEFGRL